jgi:hypothetical protein
MTVHLEHSVGPAEHIGTIAARYGFRDPDTIWNDEANTELRKLRGNPYTLAPGDVVMVPMLEPLVVERGTGTTHRFELEELQALLTLRLLDTDGAPRAGLHAVLRTATKHQPLDPEITRTHVGPTDGDGRVTAVISPFADFGELRLETRPDSGLPQVVQRYRLVITALPPVNSLAGQRLRLNNLGYFAGFSRENVRQLRWAIEEFEFENDLKPQGRPDNPEFFNRLGHVHGDLLPHERADLPLID